MRYLLVRRKARRRDDCVERKRSEAVGAVGRVNCLNLCEMK